MKKTLIAGSIILALNMPAIAKALPARERNIILSVAKEYNLSVEETALLLAIRKIENGGNGIELGVGQEQLGHPAKRFAAHPLRSLLCQSQWAAGTLKKRYTGDIDNFSRRYCPKNAKTWSRNAKKWVANFTKEGV